MIASLLMQSPYLQAMLLAIVGLAVFSVAGLMYPIFKGRAEYGEEAKGSAKRFAFTYGTKETAGKLKTMKQAGNYSEGIILAYRALRNLLPRAEILSQDNRNTEFEIINEMIRTFRSSPELRNAGDLLMQAYQLYERARFSNLVTTEDLDAAISLLDSIYSGPVVKRKPWGN